MKQWGKLIVVLGMLCLLTGCRQTSLLGSRLFAEAVGVDAEGHASVVTIMGYLADQGSEGGSQCITAGGATVTEALAALTGHTGREPYFPHNSALVVSTAAARQGLLPVLLFFTDYTGCRPGVPLFVAEEQAASVVAALEGDNGPDAQLLQRLTDPEKMAGRTVSTPLYTTLTVRGAGDFAAPLVRAEENGISVTGTALFRSGVMTGRLTAEETVGLHLLQGTLKNTLICCALPEGWVTVAITADDMTCESSREGIRLKAVCRGQIFESDFPVNPDGTGPLETMLEAECRRQLTAWVQAAAAQLQRSGANVCRWPHFPSGDEVSVDIRVEMSFPEVIL